jgi:hypothetical protein
MKQFPILSLLLIVFVTFSACRKEEIVEAIDEFLAPKVQAIAEQNINALVDIIQEEVSKHPALNGGVGTTKDSCVVITFTPKSTTDSFPATLRLNYGTGCTVRGNTVSGIVTVTVTGKTSQVGSTLNVVFENVKVNNNGLNGKMSLTTTGAKDQAQQSFNYTLTDFTIVTKEGKTATFSTLTGSRTQVAGNSTTVKTNGKTAFSDDAFEITLNGSGKNSDGKDFTVKTISPLRREYNCKWFVSGKLEYTVGLKKQSIDYGSSCDNILTITIGSITKTIELP